MANLMRVRTVWTGVAGSPYYTNFFFTTSNITADAQEVVDRVDTAFTALNTIIAGGLSAVIEPDVPVFEDTTGEINNVLTTTGGAFDPTGAGEPLPWATQGLVRFTTNTFVQGRRVRGRVFIPGLLETSSDAGAPNTNVITSLNAFGTALLVNSPPSLVVWSRPRPADPAAVPPVAARAGSQHLVVNALAWDKWAVLRSRRD